MNKLVKQLEAMVGKTYNYGGRIHYVKTVVPNVDEAKFTIRTNLDIYERSYESGPDFLTYWTEAINTLPTAPEAQEVSLMEKDTATVDKLTELLMDNIIKVQQDAGYIKQAQSINNNVNSILNLTKLKLDVLKQSRRR